MTTSVKKVETRTLKNLKHAKVRGKYIHVDVCIKNVRYRFSTKKAATIKNLVWVEQNYLDLVEKYKKDCEMYNSNVGIDIETYGWAILEQHFTHSKKATERRYMNIFKKYIIMRIGDMEVSSVKPRNARDIFSQFSDLSATNKALVLVILKLIFRNAVLDEIVAVNPFLEIKNHAKKEVKEELHKIFSKDEIFRILENCNERIMKLYLAIAFFTGMRPNEILALQGKDIDLEKGLINVYKNVDCTRNIDCTKTENNRIVEIVEPLRLFLEKNFRVSNENNFIFAGRYNRLQSETNFRRKFKKILNKLNIPYKTLYSTRHTFTSQMAANGEDIQWVSAQLGHKNTDVTFKHYLKYVPKDKIRGESFVGDMAKILKRNTA